MPNNRNRDWRNLNEGEPLPRPVPPPPPPEGNSFQTELLFAYKDLTRAMDHFAEVMERLANQYDPDHTCQGEKKGNT